MRYKLLGKSGLVVSRMALGAMTFTGGNHSMPRINKVNASLADGLVGRALDAGVTLFDTADVYDVGQSEELLGATLGRRRADIVLATKCGLRTGAPLTQSGLSARHIHASIDGSLKRLKTDWIDLYIAHRPDPLVPLEESLSALDAIVRAGKVRYLGYSNWPAWLAASAVEMQKANGWAPFIHGQMHYSALIRDIERDTIPMMAHHGLGLTVWSPLAFGFLSGRITRDNLDADDHRFKDQIFTFDLDKGFELVAVLETVGKAHDVSPAQVAMTWLLSKSAVSSIIMGVSKVAQLDDNLAALNVTLGDDEIAAIEATMPLVPTYPNWFEAMLRDRPLVDALA